MGYYYYINGSITFSNKKAYMIMKYLHKEGQHPFEEELEGFDFDDTDKTITIDMSIKNYNEYMEKLFLFAHTLDNKVKGEADCDGEDKDDRYAIHMNKTGIFRRIAETIYKKEKGYITDEDTIKNAKILLKDKQLNKKLIVFALEDEGK
jgi:hypothetical protein